MSHRFLAVVGVVSLAMAPPHAGAQTPDAAARELLSELQQMRAALEETRIELRRLREEVDALKVRPPETPPAVEILQSQMAEHAQTKVESASRLPLRLSGTIHSSTAFNSGEANWLENPNIVGVAPAEGTGSFTSTLRQTRIGLDAAGLDLGAGWQGQGTLILDFFGGMPAFPTGAVMGLPRLIYAFARFEREGTALQVGQDEMLLAPRDPTSLAALSFPLLFRSGNLYLRVPHARIEQQLAGRADGGLRAAIAVVAPIGGDFRSTAYTFVPPALGGERSRHPAVQARIEARRAQGDRVASVAASGHYGRERPAAELTTSWAAALDFHVSTRRFGLLGEGFVGENLDAFGGALGQPFRTAGGFLEGQFRPADRWELVAGGGSDRPQEPAVLQRNTSGYGSVLFRLTPEVATALEYRWLETRAATRRRNHHYNWSFVYSF
jgi:hypothetical protein